MSFNSIVAISDAEIGCIFGGINRDGMARRGPNSKDDQPKKNDPISAAFAFGFMVLVGVIGLISIVICQQQEIDKHKEKERLVDDL